jgi:hypothetical protein
MPLTGIAELICAVLIESACFPAPLLRCRWGDDRGDRPGCRGGGSEDLAAGQAVPAPQGGGPGADHRVDQVLAVFVVHARQRRRSLDQLARGRMRIEIQRWVRNDQPG